MQVNFIFNSNKHVLVCTCTLCRGKNGTVVQYCSNYPCYCSSIYWNVLLLHIHFAHSLFSLLVNQYYNASNAKANYISAAINLYMPWSWYKLNRAKLFLHLYWSYGTCNSDGGMVTWFYNQIWLLFSHLIITTNLWVKIYIWYQKEWNVMLFIWWACRSTCFTITFFWYHPMALLMFSIDFVLFVLALDRIDSVFLWTLMI